MYVTESNEESTAMQPSQSPNCDSIASRSQSILHNLKSTLIVLVFKPGQTPHSHIVDEVIAEKLSDAEQRFRNRRSSVARIVVGTDQIDLATEIFEACRALGIKARVTLVGVPLDDHLGKAARLNSSKLSFPPPSPPRSDADLTVVSCSECLSAWVRLNRSLRRDSCRDSVGANLSDSAAYAHYLKIDSVHEDFVILGLSGECMTADSMDAVMRTHWLKEGLFRK